MGKPHLTAEQRALALRLRAQGLNFTEIGEQIDSSLQTAWNVIMKPPTRIVKPFSWSPGPGRLRLAEREEISLGLAAGSDAHRHRCPTRPVGLDGLPRGDGQWRTRRLSGLAGPRTGPATIPAAQTEEAGVSRAGSRGDPVPAQMVVAAGDLQAVASRAPRRSDDVGEPRNDLQDPVHPGQRRAAPRADPVLAVGTGKEMTPGPT